MGLEKPSLFIINGNYLLTGNYLMLVFIVKGTFVTDSLIISFYDFYFDIVTLFYYFI